MLVRVGLNGSSETSLSTLFPVKSVIVIYLLDNILLGILAHFFGLLGFEVEVA